MGHAVALVRIDDPTTPLRGRRVWYAAEGPVGLDWGDYRAVSDAFYEDGTYWVRVHTDQTWHDFVAYHGRLRQPLPEDKWPPGGRTVPLRFLRFEGGVVRAERVPA